MSIIARLLYRLTTNRPCRRIDRGDSSRYLERYWLRKFRSATAYLHRFVAKDADDWVHDHPWKWSIAIVLTGGYIEERLLWWSPRNGWHSVIRKVGGWRRINFIGPATFHRITETQPETWTLFIHGPRVPLKGWGFLQRQPIEIDPESIGIDPEFIRPGKIIRDDRCEVSYIQPFNIERAADWSNDVPLACNADRAPLAAGGEQ